MFWVLLLISGAVLGCNATCLRDTDCMGASVCVENRCLLVTPSGGAGRGDDSPGGSPDAGAQPARGDAGD